MRPARALIDLQALRHNYQIAREVSGAKALAVIKADAYGHGAVRCAQALEAEADGFAVACIEEALELRAAGIRAPVLLLEGFFEADELSLIVEHDFWCVVHSLWQLEAIEKAALSKPIDRLAQAGFGHAPGGPASQGLPGGLPAPAGQRQSREDRADEPLRPCR